MRWDLQDESRDGHPDDNEVFKLLYDFRRTVLLVPCTYHNRREEVRVLVDESVDPEQLNKLVTITVQHRANSAPASVHSQYCGHETKFHWAKLGQYHVLTEASISNVVFSFFSAYSVGQGYVHDRFKSGYVKVYSF